MTTRPEGATRTARPRAALSARELAKMLPGPERLKVRIRVEHALEHGTGWLWLGGGICYTAVGVRAISDAFAETGDVEAAAVCAHQAQLLEEEDRAAEPAAAPPPAEDVAAAKVRAYQAMLEQRHLA